MKFFLFILNFSKSERFFLYKKGYLNFAVNFTEFLGTCVDLSKIKDRAASIELSTYKMLPT